MQFNSVDFCSVISLSEHGLHATFQMFVIIKLSWHLEAWVLDMILNTTL